MATRVMTIEQKRYRIQNALALLNRCIKLVSDAESTYLNGLTNGEGMLAIHTMLSSKLASALAIKDDVHVILSALEDQFPYYIDVNLLPYINENRPELNITDGNGSVDIITVTDHPDALNVFSGDAGYKVLIERTGDINDGVIAQVEDVTPHSVVSGNSTLELKTGSVDGSTTDDTGVITLVEKT